MSVWIKPPLPGGGCGCPGKQGDPLGGGIKRRWCGNPLPRVTLLPLSRRTTPTVTVISQKPATPKTPGSTVPPRWPCLRMGRSSSPTWETSAYGRFSKIDRLPVGVKPTKKKDWRGHCFGLTATPRASRFAPVRPRVLWSGLSHLPGALRLWRERHSSVHHVARHRRLYVQLQLQVGGWSKVKHH